jgi:hypothetical protein
MSARIHDTDDLEAVKLSSAGIYRAALRMAGALAATFILISFSAETLKPIFETSRLLNGLIAVVFAIGVAMHFKNTISLLKCAEWMNLFFAGRAEADPPGAIAPLAFLLKNHRRNRRPYIEAGVMRTLLGTVRARLDDAKALPGYLSNVLVFVGLLGTFWGLLLTIGSFGDIVRNLALDDGGARAIFETLKANIARPLSGMGTAFSTSLFGLGATLVLGFLHMQSGLARDHFFHDLEENMMRYTRIVAIDESSTGAGSIITYLQAMLEQTADNLNLLQRTVAKSIDTNSNVAEKMQAAAQGVSALASEMRAKLKTMERISSAPEKLYPILSDLVKISKSGFGMDDRTREHIRNLDFGIAEMSDKISGDIRLLAKTIAAK